MRIELPYAPPDYSRGYFNQLVTSLRTYFNQVVSKDEETHRVVLRSPDGTNYDVTVTDAGSLVVTPSEKARV